MTTPRRLHHIALGAADVERVAAFYGHVFGLPEIGRHFDGAGELRSIWLDAQGVVLMVERTPAPARFVEGVGSGPFLLAFAISPDERARFERALTDAGCCVESRSPFTSYARDPEGNRVAVSHYPDAAPPDGAEGLDGA